MSTFIVDVAVEFYKTYSVEASSREEAEELAMETFNYECSSDWDSFYTTNITEMENDN